MLILTEMIWYWNSCWYQNSMICYWNLIGSEGHSAQCYASREAWGSFWTEKREREAEPHGAPAPQATAQRHGNRWVTTALQERCENVVFFCQNWAVVPTLYCLGLRVASSHLGSEPPTNARDITQPHWSHDLCSCFLNINRKSLLFFLFFPWKNKWEPYKVRRSFQAGVRVQTFRGGARQWRTAVGLKSCRGNLLDMRGCVRGSGEGPFPPRSKG